MTDLEPTTWEQRFAVVLRRWWRRLVGEPVPTTLTPVERRPSAVDAEASPEPAARLFPRRRCSRCGIEVAHSRHGRQTWPHWCADGYGIVDDSGVFHPRRRQRLPALPLPTARAEGPGGLAAQ